MKYRIDYEQVLARTEEISAMAADLRKQAAALDRMEQTCRTGWQGEASQVFLRKLQALREQVWENSRNMSRLSEKIRFCADRIQQEDRRAEELARTLSSGEIGK